MERRREENGRVQAYHGRTLMVALDGNTLGEEEEEVGREKDYIPRPTLEGLLTITSGRNTRSRGRQHEEGREWERKKWRGKRERL